MTITVKFGQAGKDSPSLNVMDGRYAVAEHSPLVRTNSSQGETPYQVKFPMWFRQNQQTQVLQEVSRRFNELALQWNGMDIVDDEIIWSTTSLLNQNPDAISLAAPGNAMENQYQLNISWPASNERIVSKPVNPEAAVNLPSHNYKLKLHVDGREHELNVAVSQSYGQVDSNQQVLKRLAIAINSQQSSVKASLDETLNPSNPMQPYRMPGRSLQMTIQGQAADFYLEDVEGNLAATYGLNYNQPGGPAVLSVDGVAHSAHGNLVNINDLVGVIKDSGQFKVQVDKGPAPLLKSVNQFLAGYNELIDYIAMNNDYLRPSLKDRLIRPQQDMAARLAEIGLNVDQQGHITPGRSFSQNILGDYKKTSQRLFKGDDAWAPALMEQMNTIQQIGLKNYASSLLPQSEEQVRSRAWLALDSLREKIISAYY